MSKNRVSGGLTWKRPTKALEAMTAQKLLVKAIIATVIPLPMIARELTHLALQVANRTGRIRHPSMFPRYKADASILI
jgi:hypothetical protein